MSFKGHKRQASNSPPASAIAPSTKRISLDIALRQRSEVPSDDEHRRRGGSEPPEDTKNDLPATEPKFLSFAVKNQGKRKTRVPKRHKSMLRAPFNLNGLEKKARQERPSLASLDQHRIPPILPVPSYSSYATKRFAELVPQQLRPTIVSTILRTSASQTPRPSGSMKAALHNSGAGPNNAVLTTSFYKKLPRMPSVPEEETNREDHKTSKAPAVPGAWSSFESTSSHSSVNTSFSKNLSSFKSNDPVSMSFTGMSSKAMNNASAAMSTSFSGKPPIAAKAQPVTGITEANVEACPAVSFTAVQPYPQPRQGYGFFYSDSSDSDDSEDEETTEAIVHPGEPIINPDSSFNDKVVLRTDADWDFWKAGKRLPCTHATADDSMKLKVRAKKLLEWAEAEDVFFQMSNRLERMLSTELDKTHGRLTDGMQPPSLYDMALKLRAFMRKVSDERIEMGECDNFVNHELKWAEWFVDATKAGVMHIKVKGCKCRPSWPEKEDEN
ncbi:hypothetical protein BU26DRAFT_516142 [Trematosphaeria pertusa]|uniref:Uncharacterized protein n=1 Tax=Trematosphaeria pertusa TaxID=390896 RepID=A0A6A6IW81_9PLEO|nr:uncharacterized protein BU26DRAFT_516142 [Trematosphaeria pertusa]KAF2253870.1 hypothetical protein BU26DRAFT_516142 [Trematosphaeria pertusa]